jgi:hypothetical protein
LQKITDDLARERGTGTVKAVLARHVATVKRSEGRDA